MNRICETAGSNKLRLLDITQHATPLSYGSCTQLVNCNTDHRLLHFELCNTGCT